jgi:hypothetical protein
VKIRNLQKDSNRCKCRLRNREQQLWNDKKHGERNPLQEDARTVT